MRKKYLISMIAGVLLLISNANAEEVNKESRKDQYFPIDLTEIVVTALVLGFGYSVLQNFKNKNG